MAVLGPILDHMRDLVGRFVDKGLLEFTYVHTLLWEYAQAITAPPGSAAHITDLVTQLCDAAPKLMSTKPGARVVCVVCTHSTAKERKRLIKSLKGKVLESVLHPSAHLAVLRLVDVTDDTVNIQKSLLDEICGTAAVTKYTAGGQVVGTPYPPFVSIAHHYFGRKLLLRLLAPHKRHLEPDEEALFVDGAATASKKSSDSRRLEHLAYIRHNLGTDCCKHCTDSCTALH